MKNLQAGQVWLIGIAASESVKSVSFVVERTGSRVRSSYHSFEFLVFLRGNNHFA